MVFPSNLNLLDTHTKHLLVVVEETCNECGTDAETEKYREAEAFCLGIKNEVKRIMQDEKETLPHSRPQLNNFIVKMDVFINKMKLAVKAKEDEDRDKVRRAAVQVAVAAKKKQAKMSNDEYWAKVSYDFSGLAEYFWIFWMFLIGLKRRISTYILET